MIIRNETTTLGTAGRMAVTASRLLVLAGIVGFALLTALAAKVQVPMVPAPVTLQTAMVLLAGVMLGPIAGAASVALYLGMGISGLPVFAGPVAGPAYLVGPTGGYLVGFFAGVVIVGMIAGPGRHSLARLGTGTGLGSVAILACGAAWLATGIRQGVSVETALAIGVVPFLPGAVAKMMIVVALAKLADGARIQIR